MLLMNDITKITIIFAAILVLLMIVLIIVTVKVLKGGKDNDEDDKSDVGESVKKALSDEGDGQEDEEYEEDSEASEEDSDEEEITQETASAVTEAEAEAEPEESTPDYGDESDDDIYDEDEYSNPTDDITELQKEVRKASPEYENEDTLVMDDVVDEVRDAQEALIDSEFADSAFAPKSVADKLAATVAKADEEKKAEYEARKAARKADVGVTEAAPLVGTNVNPPADDVILPKAEADEVVQAKTVNLDKVEEAVSEAVAETSDSAFSDSAFGDSAFGDSAFGDDSAFGNQPEVVEEHIHPLPETSQTIPVNPVNAVNISTVNAVDTVNTTNESAGISDMNQVKDFLEENPVPKKKKRKIKKKEQEFVKKFGDLEPHFKKGNCYWYNNQDIANLTKKEDMYFYCHYFNDAEDAVMPLIVEMYDCAFVRTEEIQYIAYGVRFKSMNFRQIVNTKEHIEFDITTATKQPSENDLMLIYDKWCSYVDKFLEIIVFNAPDNVRDEIIEKMYEYGRNDVDVLMESPE